MPDIRFSVSQCDSEASIVFILEDYTIQNRKNCVIDLQLGDAKSQNSKYLTTNAISKKLWNNILA